MNPLRVALLNASFNDEATRRNFDRDVNADVTPFDATRGELPERYDWHAAIVSGSAAAAYGDEEWIPPLSAWLETAIERDLPVLGVCFGHQLLAQVLGGEVRDMGEYELGYREMERTRDSDLLAELPDRFLVFATHSDEVVALPPGAELLAENDYSIQAFRKEPSSGCSFTPSTTGRRRSGSRGGRTSRTSGSSAFSRESRTRPSRPPRTPRWCSTTSSRTRRLAPPTASGVRPSSADGRLRPTRRWRRFARRRSRLPRRADTAG